MYPSIKKYSLLEETETVTSADTLPVSAGVHYMHVVHYRKCYDCGYIGWDSSFLMKFETTYQTENAISQMVHTHCPKCDSEKLSDYFMSKEDVK